MIVTIEKKKATVFFRELALNKAALKEVRVESLNLLEDGKVSTIFLDLENTGIIDSLTLGFLVLFHNKCKESGVKYFIVNLDPEQLELFKSTGLNNFLSFKFSEDALDFTDASIELGLSLDYEDINNEIGVISFSGIMNTKSDSRLFCGIASKVIEEGRKVLLNMGDMTFIDSLGINEIVKLHKASGEDSQRLRICNAGEIMHDLLESSKLDKILGIYKTKEEALDNWV